MVILLSLGLDRGEAANHGICDAARLRDELVLWRDGKQSLEQAFDKYQMEVKSRTHDAVIMSRHACFDCHDLNSLRVDSPVFQVVGFNALAKQARAYI
jgi:2-polyprenyl-6-methoxyphenol hydroxylase-like FAD-dependent oxidoreductase